MHKIFTSPDHPQTNGQVERMNRYVDLALTAYANNQKTDWDEYLNAIALVYQTSFIDAIGNTPFYLLYGCDPRLPTDVLSSTPLVLDIDAQYKVCLSHKRSKTHIQLLKFIRSQPIAIATPL